MTLLNNSDTDIPGGSVIEFDVSTATPGTIADQSGLGMTVITNGSNASGNNIGGLENNFHRVSFTIPGWQTIPAGESLEGDIKVQLPTSTPSNFTIEISGVKYGFSEEHGGSDGQTFCELNPTDPICTNPPPPADSCEALGVDTSAIAVYPQYPSGDHAKGTEQMVLDNSLYTAKWWTTVAPPSNDWDFVCKVY